MNKPIVLRVHSMPQRAVGAFLLGMVAPYTFFLFEHLPHRKFLFLLFWALAIVLLSVTVPRREYKVSGRAWIRMLWPFLVVLLSLCASVWCLDTHVCMCGHNFRGITTIVIAFIFGFL